MRASGLPQRNSGLLATFEQAAAPYRLQPGDLVVYAETEVRPNEGWCPNKKEMDHAEQTIYKTGPWRSFGARDELVKETKTLVCLDDGDDSDDDGIQNASHHQLHHVQR